jgi:Domain of unknown function (DUF1918)
MARGHEGCLHEVLALRGLMVRSGDDRESMMKAQVGDELVVKGLRVGDHDRKGVIIEVHGEDGGPPYLVRWDDGHESSFYPSAGTVAEHLPLRAGVQAPTP